MGSDDDEPAPKAKAKAKPKPAAKPADDSDDDDSDEPAPKAKAKAKTAAKPADGDDDDSDDDEEPAPKAKAKAKAKAVAKDGSDDDDDDDGDEAPPKPKPKLDISGTGSKASEDKTVFVGGLPFSTTEEQLKKDFSECGTIVKFNMPLNDEGRPKGIAFITFETEDAVKEALKYDGDEYGGRTLKVNKAGDRGKGKGKD